VLNGTDPTWTPDGRSLIYENYADGQIWTCGVSGENPRLLVRMKPDEVATELRTSPDGKMNELLRSRTHSQNLFRLWNECHAVCKAQVRAVKAKTDTGESVFSIAEGELRRSSSS
jgi:hypothetical protein